jgi:hypothetical protein
MKNLALVEGMEETRPDARKAAVRVYKLKPDYFRTGGK